MKFTRKKFVQTSCLLSFLFTLCSVHAQVTRLELNQLVLGIDGRTGGVAHLSHPATGVILQASEESAGLIDLAYPTEAFAPQRLATQFSDARVVTRPNGVAITWDALGPSRSNFPLPSGKVLAQVSIRAADDGRSVILSCRIENHSSAPVPQVLFPDLRGLRPFQGVKATRLRFPTATVRPFVEPYKPAHSTPFYARLGWNVYRPGGYMFGDNSLRWLDLGSLRSGLSVFQKKWATNDRPSVLTYRSESDPMSMRLAWEHRTTIEPGQTWESGEFWLTPHRGGWAKGIEVYRDFVTVANPPRELPRHVRDGLGFQTIWLTQDIERDPGKADFRFRDLPSIARDAREHGIEELVLWGWCLYARFPIEAREDLGTMEEFVEGVRKARQIGVNVSPFVSVQYNLNRYLDRYGVEPGGEDWTYHPEFIPIFRPYYSKFGEGAHVSPANEVWRQDVLAALTGWMDRGVYSFSWDQFFSSESHGKQKSPLVTLIEEVRRRARAKDPQSTFAAESVQNLELDSAVLDYTWVWAGCGDGFTDAAPLLNVLRSPRPNCSVEDSPLVVKQAFSDGMYLHLFPRKPDRPNGTALIGDKPALSAALKEVAALRQQFLPFFTEGRAIGDSVLSEPATAFVRGHQLDNKLLVIALNDRDAPQRVGIQSDLELWLPSAETYGIKYYDSAGKLVSTTQAKGPEWVHSTPLLQPLELAFFEIQAE